MIVAMLLMAWPDMMIDGVGRSVGKERASSARAQEQHVRPPLPASSASLAGWLARSFTQFRPTTYGCIVTSQVFCHTRNG